MGYNFVIIQSHCGRDHAGEEDDILGNSLIVEVHRDEAQAKPGWGLNHYTIII